MPRPVTPLATPPSIPPPAPPAAPRQPPQTHLLAAAAWAGEPSLLGCRWAHMRLLAPSGSLLSHPFPAGRCGARPLLCAALAHSRRRAVARCGVGPARLGACCSSVPATPCLAPLLARSGSLLAPAGYPDWAHPSLLAPLLLRHAPSLPCWAPLPACPPPAGPPPPFCAPPSLRAPLPVGPPSCWPPSMLAPPCWPPSLLGCWLLLLPAGSLLAPLLLAPAGLPAGTLLLLHCWPPSCWRSLLALPAGRPAGSLLAPPPAGPPLPAGPPPCWPPSLLAPLPAGPPPPCWLMLAPSLLAHNKGRQKNQ
ncbi:unnamed protein product [Arctogadus glacialis]